jgi:glycosyltransferase involved in cell wall biosynthesis/O-antigen/teichoic acid export membrane protein
MIEPRALAQFLSGRAIGLLVLLGFQVLAVRALPAVEYGRYALIIGLAALSQTITGVGLPRVAARFLPGGGLSRGARRWLVAAMLGMRTMLSLATAALAGLTVWLLGPADAALYAPGGAYALCSALQLDADGMAQALGLQIASRRASVGEPMVRLAAAAALALGGQHSAAPLLWISAATAGAAAGGLVLAVLAAPSPEPLTANRADRLDWPAIRRVAIGGYGGTLSWLAFSPGMMRLVASRALPPEQFAGFAFVQSLVVSLQRYMPSFLLFPLVEPALMGEAAQGGVRKFSDALSLLVKLDAVLIGGGIICVSAAGGPIILALTHGRYGEAGAYAPWLLLGLIANTSHRSYEIAAIGLGAAEALIRSLGLTLFWLAAAVLTAPLWGVWPLLLCPLGDAWTRLWLIERALPGWRGGIGAPLVDPQQLGLIGTGAVLLSAVAAQAAWVAHEGLAASLGVGMVCMLGFFAAAPRIARLHDGQAAFLAESAPWLTQWGRGYSARRLQVWVLTPRGAGGAGGVDRLMDNLRPLMAEHAGLKVYFLTTRGGGRRLSPLVTLLALVRLITACIVGRCDLLHVNLGSNGSCYRKLLLLAVPRLFSRPYIVHLHGSAFEPFWSSARPWVRRAIDQLFRDAAHVVVLSEAWRTLLARRLPGVRATVMANATPTPQSAPPAAGPLQILFLGELGPRKGASLLVEALAQLKGATPWRAVIAGEGDAGTLRRQAARLNLTSRVDFPGWVDAQAVQDLLSASHVLALPSFEEALPMAVIEAFAWGLAVVATPVGALPDIVWDRETGLLVAPGDVEGLACALDLLLETPTLRQSLGCAAKARHRQDLSIRPYADRLCALWRRSLSRSAL